MSKGIFNNKFADYAIEYTITIILLVGAIFGLIFVQKFVGYAGVEVPAEAGTITSIIIDDRRPTAFWHGLYGLVFSEPGWNEEQTATLAPGELSAFTVVFDCVDPNKEQNEIYASTYSEIDFSKLQAGSVEMIDDGFLNLTDETRKDRANNTFTEFINVSVGATTIENVPAAYTYVNDAPDSNNKFYTGILNESGKLVLVTGVWIELQTSFKGSNVKYQMLLPVPNSSTKYYFFADPNDECPSGWGMGQVGDATIQGYVFESNTTMLMPNVTVSAGGNTSLTDSNGFFNFTVPGGRTYKIVAIKYGYITNISSVSTQIGYTSYKNLTMSKFFGYRGPNGTISGYVQDSETKTIIEDATISIEGLITYSNATGNYSLKVEEGTHVIAAVKNGYYNFVGNFSINAYQNLSHIINMTRAAEIGNATILKNGTIRGTVTDSINGNTLQDVTVTVAGVSNITDINGSYNITTLEGTTNLVATKNGYESYFGEVNITANNITVYNFSMEPITIIEGAPNGTLKGTVRTSSGNLLSDVTVSIVGKSNLSNSTGEYLLLQIPAGTHNLIATRSGYDNYFTEVNITEYEITEHNITMVTTVEAGLGVGQGAGQGPGMGTGKGVGQGAGRGAGTGIQAQIEQPVEIVDYEVSVDKIIKKLRKGNFITVPITISNHREESINVRFSVEGDVKDMIRIDKEMLVIEGNSDGGVTLTILGNVDPGIYEGNFVVSGDIDKKIPIYILVLEKERLAIEALVIKITPEKKKLTAGSLLKYRVDLQNLLSDENYKVDLSYSIEGITNNRSIFIEKEDIVILTSFSLLKRYRLPLDLEKGDYSLKVKAEFLGLTSEHSTIFTVTEPIYKYALFGIIPLWIISIILALLSTFALIIFVYKKKAAEKRRYQIEIDYTQLPKAGPRSAYIGNVAETRAKTYLNLDHFQVHTIVAGASGSGKTVVAQDLVEEALLKGVSVIVFDPTAQWTGFLRRCQDKKMLSSYAKFGMKKTDAKAFSGNIYQVENAREIIDFKKIMKPSEINIFVTGKLATEDIELFVANTIREIFHSNLPESRQLKYLLIYDGIHSLLPKFGGTGQVFVQIERATREFRKWGVGLILISQVISDFPPEVLANINTEIQMRTRDEGDLKRTKEEYGDKILQSVVKAAVGTGMVESSAYNKGKPYFVACRPIMHNPQRVSDKELDNYNKYNKIIDDLDYQLEQLEKEKIDIFDLKLELKLAQDKVKSGSFNMVDIYLEGLKPRIKAQWDKLGKHPKKREIKYVSEEDLEKELKTAKKEKEKVEEEIGEGTKEKGQSKEKNNVPEEKKPEEETEGIDSIIKQVHSSIEANDKEKLISLYKKLQSIYKNSSKEDKMKILQVCNLIRQKLSKK